MSLPRRTFLKWLSLAGVTAALKLPAAGSAHSLSILTTGRALQPAVARSFMQLTGAQLAAVVAPEPASLTGFDLAIVPAHTLVGFIGQGEVRELGQAGAVHLAEQRAYDPQNIFSRPAACGLIGINARGAPVPASWAEFFVQAQTVPTHLPAAESFHAALRLQHESINSRNPIARNTARSIVAGLTSAPLSQAMLAVGPPMDGWEFAVPLEGAEQWEDCFCLPTESAQPALSMAFMRYALEARPPATLTADRVYEFRSPFAPAAEH